MNDILWEQYWGTLIAKIALKTFENIEDGVQRNQQDPIQKFKGSENQAVFGTSSIIQL